MCWPERDEIVSGIGPIMGSNGTLKITNSNNIGEIPTNGHQYMRGEVLYTADIAGSRWTAMCNRKPFPLSNKIMKQDKIVVAPRH